MLFQVHTAVQLLAFQCRLLQILVGLLRRLLGLLASHGKCCRAKTVPMF